MLTINVTQARKNIYKLLSDVNIENQPITITNSKGKNGVLVSEDNWNAIQESLYLNFIPNMAESIIEGRNTPIVECISQDEVKW